MPTKEINIEEIKTEMDRLGKVLETAKTNKATFTGRLQEAMKRLKEDLKFSSVEEASAEAVLLDADCKKLQEQINSKYTSLQENYEW
jgi:uncharacterized FlaG/YvyC family protein